MNHKPLTPVGLLVDLDGTVWNEVGVIPGVPEAIATVREAGMPLRFVTNITREPRKTVARWLVNFGIPATADDIFTPALAAAAWLRENGVRRAFLCLPEQTKAEFSEFGNQANVGEEPTAVVMGDMGAAWSFNAINGAFRVLLAGGEFVALHKNRYWRTPDGLCLDAGAFVAALEFATGRTATLVGKPSPLLFGAAARSMGVAPAEVAMVGDTLESDVAGAKAAGCTAVLVRTGNFDGAELSASETTPDRVIDSLAGIPALLFG